MNDGERRRWQVEVRRLRRGRPKRRFLRWSALLLGLLVADAWISGGFSLEGLLSPRRQANFARFLGEVRPYPLHDRPWDSAAAAGWAGRLLADRGLPAAGMTLAISVAAIVLAGLAGLLAAFPASRTWAVAEPWLPGPRPPGRWLRGAWATVRGLVRGALVFLRAIPEYVWAFLLVAVLGPSSWPAVLALALHNAGILGKLDAEVVENLPRGPLAALAGAGARRAQVAVSGVLPRIVPRLLLFFFYRWETCVREATILGLLGIVSLGYLVEDARARNRYDDLVLYLLVGSALVLVGDLVSALARKLVRDAG